MSSTTFSEIRGRTARDVYFDLVYFVVFALRQVVDSNSSRARTKVPFPCVRSGNAISKDTYHSITTPVLKPLAPAVQSRRGQTLHA